VADIFKIPHFQTLIRKQERLLGKPVADPFVIAKAQSIGGCVITTEKYKKMRHKFQMSVTGLIFLGWI